ncbi:MAG: DUF1028 domain-containing protein [Planctomycetota bacterium]
MLRALLRLGLAAALLARPVLATWSIILIDTRTGEIAVASATCLQNFDLAVWVPVVVVGKGAACAQSFVDPSGANRLYIRDQLLLGTAPDQILAGLAASDPGHQSRQYGFADVQGRTRGFTGTGAGAYASDRTGRVGDIVYAIQGNVLTGGPVLAAAEIAIYATPGDLGEKLMAAMQAARQFGGDGRCSCNEGNPTGCGSPPPNFTKSADVAFMIVARPGDVDGLCNPTVGCASGSYTMRLNVANRVRTDPDPVVLLQGLYDQWKVQQRGRFDQFRSTLEFASPSLPINGLTVVNARLVLRDREGTPLGRPATSVQIVATTGTTTNATLGALRDNGDGTYDLPITAGTAPGRLVLRATVDDGNGARPLPEVRIDTSGLNDRLWASRVEISATAGGVVDFAVQPGPFFGANKTWVLLASLSGTRPGVQIPPFYNLPLNYDAMLELTALAAFGGFMPELSGQTPVSGLSATAVRFPPGLYALPVGRELSFAYALVNPTTMTSNPVSIRIVP